jgi:hypothetical protein
MPVAAAQTLAQVARQALDGVGDTSQGEWWQTGIRAVHLRRRLSTEEERQIGPVRDIRGTAEQLQRYRRVLPYLLHLPALMRQPL